MTKFTHIETEYGVSPTKTYGPIVSGHTYVPWLTKLDEPETVIATERHAVGYPVTVESVSNPHKRILYKYNIGKGGYKPGWFPAIRVYWVEGQEGPNNHMWPWRMRSVDWGGIHSTLWNTPWYQMSYTPPPSSVSTPAVPFAVPGRPVGKVGKVVRLLFNGQYQGHHRNYMFYRGDQVGYIVSSIGYAEPVYYRFNRATRHRNWTVVFSAAVAGIKALAKEHNTTIQVLVHGWPEDQMPELCTKVHTVDGIPLPVTGELATMTMHSNTADGVDKWLHTTEINSDGFTQPYTVIANMIGHAYEDPLRVVMPHVRDWSVYPMTNTESFGGRSLNQYPYPDAEVGGTYQHAITDYEFIGGDVLNLQVIFIGGPGPPNWVDGTFMGTGTVDLPIWYHMYDVLPFGTLKLWSEPEFYASDYFNYNAFLLGQCRQRFEGHKTIVWFDNVPPYREEQLLTFTDIIQDWGYPHAPYCNYEFWTNYGPDEVLGIWEKYNNTWIHQVGNKWPQVSAHGRQVFGELVAAHPEINFEVKSASNPSAAALVAAVKAHWHWD